MKHTGNSVTVVMYHYIRDLKKSRYPAIKGLDYKLFKTQIEYFLKNYNIISMEDIIESLDTGCVLPEKAMLLTFDDGYKDHYEYVFPILDKYKLQGSFFVPGKTFEEGKLLDVNKIHFILAGGENDEIIKKLRKEIEAICKEEPQMDNFETLWKKYAKANRFDDGKTIFIKRVLQTGIPEKYRNDISSKLFDEIVCGGGAISEKQFAAELYMNRDQLECMKRNGMFFGLHGYDHYWLNNLPGNELRNDIRRAKQAMRNLVDENSWVMCYPYGATDDTVRNVVKAEGGVLGFTTEVSEAQICESHRYDLPRFDTNDFYPKKR